MSRVPRPDFTNPLDRLLAALGDRVVRHRGDRAEARCPAHDDRQPSLSAWLATDGWACVRCHAGCSRAAILAALGLTVADLGPVRAMGARSVPLLPPRSAASPADPTLARQAWARALGGARRELAAGGGPGLAYLATRLDAERALALAHAGEMGVDEMPTLGTCLAVPLRDLAEGIHDVAFRSAGGRGFRRVGGAAEGLVLAMVSHGLMAECDGGDLLVVEGIIDYLTARALRISAVLGLPGTGRAAAVGAALVDEIGALRQEGMYGPRRVLLATDGDAAGDRAAMELARALLPLGVTPFRARPPQGSDLTDTFVAVGVAS